MQLSVYLNDSLIRRVDRMAKKKRISRSRMIGRLIDDAMRGGGKGDRAKRILALAGSWRDHRPADKIVKDIYAGRGASGRRAELA